MSNWRAIVPKDKNERHHWMSIVLRASIAYQVRTMRLVRQWSQEQLAEKSGLSFQTISRVEDPAGDNLTVQTLFQIARAFDCALITRFSSWDSFVEQMVGLIPPAAFDQDAIETGAPTNDR